MSQPNDKPFHDWVRQSLASYQPAYQPTDWQHLQHRRQRRRRWRTGMWISLGILLIGALSWLWVRTATHPGGRVSNGLATGRPTPLRLADRPEARPGFSSPQPLSNSTGQRLPRSRSKVIAAPRVSSRRPQLHPDSIATIAIRPDWSATLTEHIHLVHPVAFSPEEAAIVHQIQTGEFGADSTAYRALDRNIRQWPSSVIVCDMTTSMYPYTTQLFAWFRKNSAATPAQGFVFYTDCDSLGRQTRPGGPPGQLYVSRSVRLSSTLPLLLAAARNTINNNDIAENTVEALLRAQNDFPQAKHLILVADNLSQVKDMHLLNRLTKPVHVVLCGTTGGDKTPAYQPDYYRLAEHTQGSLHTLEDDLNPGTLSARQTLRVGTRFYRYHARRKQFKLTPYDHRPRRFFGFVWL